MDFSRLSRPEAVGVVAGIVLVLSLIFLPWFSLEHNPTRDMGEGFICGTDEYSCTGFEAFPILRWLLIAGAAAPLILAYIVARGNKLSWPPGEMTMIVGFVATVLILYNGIIDKPGSGRAEVGVSLDGGYYVALLAAIGIAVAGFWRSMQAGGRRERKAPGTV